MNQYHACTKRTACLIGALFFEVMFSLLLTASPASAATSITNSLTGFTNNSTLGATQAALAGVGLSFTSTAGAGEDPPGTFIDPTIQFDASGASFGSLIVGDGGRNFIRTTQTDYGNVSFTAEVTWTTADMFSQAGYFGLGSAEYGSFRIADWTTPNSAVQLFMEVDPLEPEVSVLSNANGNSTFAGTQAPGMDTGTHRLRLAYDWFQKKATFSLDLNYAGGAFTADVTTPATSTIGLYGGDGWPTEAARVYFGGDDGSVFKDLALTITTPSMRLGDFNSDGNLTAADWAILRGNQLANLSGKTFSEAYFLGDVTADLANNHSDFILFKGLYDAANGVGAFEAMAGGVPEPTALPLIILAILGLRSSRRHATRGR